MVFRRITIINVRSRPTPDVNEQLHIIGGSLGLFSERDKDKSCFRVFITLMSQVKSPRGLTSDELAEATGLTRGTVVFHLNKLMASGIVEHDHGEYSLTFKSTGELINRVENNVRATLEELRTTARDVDAKLQLD